MVDKLYSLTNRALGLEHRGLGLGFGIKSLALALASAAKSLALALALTIKSLITTLVNTKDGVDTLKSSTLGVVGLPGPTKTPKKG